MARFNFRLATSADLPVLADLRWRLKTEDGAVADAAGHDAFEADFIDFEERRRTPGEAFHWVAESKGRLVAAMSVIVVRKPPAPGEPFARWGYLTNCYALPDVRNSGMGSSLLDEIKTWASQEQLEMLVVWPSDRAFSFYRRAGFLRAEDPLVLSLTAASGAAR